MESVVRIDRLSVWFGKHQVLRDVDLTFRKGELTVLIGPSGSGKTTLLRAVNRMNELFPGVRTQGDVTLEVNGETLSAYNAGTDVAALRRVAGMVFQTPNVLPASIRQNFAVPLRLVLGAKKPQIEQRMESALRDAELWDEVNDRLGDQAQALSGGQQQRLCLARALSLEPSVLLLDEPTASLDFRAARRIEEHIVRLKEHYPILAVSHSLGQVSRIADQVCVLGRGGIAERLDGSALREPEQLYRLAESLF